MWFVPMILLAALGAQDTLCVIRTPGERRDSLVIALTDSVDLARAPIARSAGERLVFAQLSEPLIRFDCAGRPITRIGGWSAGGGGDGPYRVASQDSEAIRLEPTDAAANLPRLVFRRFPGADPRDVIDAGVDLFVTADQAAIQYAARQADLASVPLPWDRTYVLVVRTPTTAARLGFERGLEHAVRVDARVSRAPYWWLAECGNDAIGSALPDSVSRLPWRSPPRVVYDRADPVSRDLADRIVALRLVSAGSSRARLLAVGLSREEFRAALTARSEWAYVLPFERGALPACWPRDVPHWVLHANPIPLVDVRARAIVRRGGGVSGLIDRDGTIRITP